MRRLIAWLIMATAVVCIAALWRFHGRPQPAAVATPPVVPVARAAAVTPPVGEPAAAAPKALKETEKDHLTAGPALREFTPEQQARLDALKKKVGELQSKIVLLGQEQGDLRTSAMGRPEIRDAVARFKSVRQELEHRTMTAPARVEADARLRDAEARVAETRHAAAAFEAHLTTHAAEGPDAHKDCGWCYRDALKIKAKDPSLSSVYKAEIARIEKAMTEADDARRTAAAARAEAIGQVAADPAIAALHAQVAEAQAALSALIEKVPEFAESKRVEQAAREEQGRLVEEVAALYSQGRVAGEPMMAGRSDAGGDKAQ